MCRVLDLFPVVLTGEGSLMKESCPAAHAPPHLPSSYPRAPDAGLGGEGRGSGGGGGGRGKREGRGEACEEVIALRVLFFSSLPEGSLL